MKIKEHAKNLMRNELFVGSLILLILINISNFLNYFFHFTMARMLGPQDYGTLAFLTSIIYIFNFPTSSIQTVVSKYTVEFNIKKEFGKIKGVLNSLLKKFLCVSLLIFILFIIISIYLSKSLNISFWLLFLTGFILFGSFIPPIVIGIFQGMKKFKFWGWNSIINSSVKVLIAILLVYIGFGIYGAIIGFLLGIVISFFLAFPFIKEVINANEIKEKINVFAKKSLPTTLAMFVIVLIYSIDIILAKAFFSPDISGKYAVASMIGKMILFSSVTIGYAMFPLSAEKFINGKKEKARDIAKKTMIFTVLLCLIATTLLMFFPELIIKILFGSQYIDASQFILYIGVAFSFISLLNILILYKISVNKFRIIDVIFISLFFILQLTVLILFHATIKEFSIAFMFSTIITFIGSLFLIKK